jgi:hypothetical protein
MKASKRSQNNAKEVLKIMQAKMIKCVTYQAVLKISTYKK